MKMKIKKRKNKKHMISLKESILSSTKSGNSAIAETIYNKLLNKEQLTDQEIRWTDTNVGVFKVDENQLRKLIRNLKYNDISLNWINVSNITNMVSMFEYSEFNGDISKWDVSNVLHMVGMFYKSKFNGDISKWDVGSVRDMSHMFYKSKFNRDISNWKINPRCKAKDIFYDCPIKNEYEPKKPQDK